MGKVLVDKLEGVRLCGVALAFDRLAQSKYIRLQRRIFELHLRGFLFDVVVLLVAQIRDQLIHAMRNSDPRVRIVFVYKCKSNFHSILTLYATGCDFQFGPNFGVPSNPTFLALIIFHHLAKMYSRHATKSVNCENSSVSFVLKYCPTSTVVRNPASVQILITRFVVRVFAVFLHCTAVLNCVRPTHGLPADRAPVRGAHGYPSKTVSWTKRQPSGCYNCCCNC